MTRAQAYDEWESAEDARLEEATRKQLAAKGRGKVGAGAARSWLSLRDHGIP